MLGCGVEGGAVFAHSRRWSSGLDVGEIWLWILMQTEREWRNSNENGLGRWGRPRVRSPTKEDKGKGRASNSPLGLYMPNDTKTLFVDPGVPPTNGCLGQQGF